MFNVSKLTGIHRGTECRIIGGIMPIVIPTIILAGRAQGSTCINIVGAEQSKGCQHEIHARSTNSLITFGNKRKYSRIEGRGHRRRRSYENESGKEDGWQYAPIKSYNLGLGAYAK